MRTKIRIWWITNQLFHYQEARGVVVWTRQIDFTTSIVATSSRLLSWPFSFFFKAKNSQDLEIEIDNLISQCCHSDIGTLRNTMDNDDAYIALTSKGEGIYAVSSLLLDNPIGIAVIISTITLVTTYFVGRILGIHIG